MQHNNILTIIVPGTPMAKVRSRRGASGHWYNPQSDEMGSVKKIIKAQLPDRFKMIPQYHPVVVNVTAFFLPAKLKRTKKFLEIIKNEDYPWTLKKDRDNIDKFVLDCMSKIVFYDDGQVYDGRITKYYTPDDPRVEIEILW